MSTLYHAILYYTHQFVIEAGEDTRYIGESTGRGKLKNAELLKDSSIKIQSP